MHFVSKYNHQITSTRYRRLFRLETPPQAVEPLMGGILTPSRYLVGEVTKTKRGAGHVEKTTCALGCTSRHLI